MTYLFVQTFIWLLATFVLGALIGWWLSAIRCRERVSAQAMATPVAGESTPDAHDAQVSVQDAWRPQALSTPPGGGDDLKRISGIGPKLESTLHELGIWRFRQIAEFTENNIAWVNTFLSFSGRIEREDWVAQARRLASDEDTEFSERNDKEG